MAIVKTSGERNTLTKGENMARSENLQNRLWMASELAFSFLKSNFSRYDAIDQACVQFGLYEDEEFCAVAEMVAIVVDGGFSH